MQKYKSPARSRLRACDSRCLAPAENATLEGKTMNRHSSAFSAAIRGGSCNALFGDRSFRQTSQVALRRIGLIELRGSTDKCNVRERLWEIAN